MFLSFEIFRPLGDSPLNGGIHSLLWLWCHPEGVQTVACNQGRYGTWTFKVMMSRPGIVSQRASEAGSSVAASTHGEPALPHIRGEFLWNQNGWVSLQLLCSVFRARWSTDPRKLYLAFSSVSQIRLTGMFRKRCLQINHLEFLSFVPNLPKQLFWEQDPEWNLYAA